MKRRDSILALATLGVASPVALAQQHGRVWRVGFLSPITASSSSNNVNAFLKGMHDLGYVEGRNLLIEWRFADGQFERLPGMATDLAQSKVDVIVAAASAAISAAQKATTTIPIVPVCQA
jgi:putative tryptophan/tyrosine transport system substrate-binding protein